jgi:putative nucleotidyltransferase with HDIG domain
MAVPSVVRADRAALKLRLAVGVVVVGFVAVGAVAGVQANQDRVGSLTAVLAIAAILSGAVATPIAGRASVSPAFIVLTLAAAFLGPASAALGAVLAEVTTSVRLRTPMLRTGFNIFAIAGPALVAANVIQIARPTNDGGAGFYLVVGLAAIVLLGLNFWLVSLYFRVFRGQPHLTLGVLWRYTPTLLLTIALAVAGAAIYVKVGLSGIAFALAALFTFSYMAHLLEQSRQRAEQYVSLSWGVLAGLMRSIDIRDQRAARHAAAVARFARDMAQEVGMSEREQELAHTAGLLHDIGHFALSDRVHERDRTLTDEDWLAIQRHPELGADMLRDLGLYGPVAEIVLAHHERADGRGYPYGLTGEEIPEIAKIISVAEVYDTLTAQDTYRTRVSSFEALTELRRVAGSQLDARYVEVLAGLLTGEGVEYRHADAADFDTELDMERRIKEARTGTG